MIQPIRHSCQNLKTFKQQPFNVVNKQNDVQSIVEQHHSFIQKENEKKAELMKRLTLSIGCFLAAGIIPLAINAITNLHLAQTKLKSKNQPKKSPIKEFENLAANINVPILEECKSLNNNLRDYLQHQVNYSKAGENLLSEVGQPNMSNRLLLYGSPGTGKSFFAKIYAKTLGAEYMEIKHSDFNSEWAGKGTDNLKKIFEHILDTAKRNQDKKYVVTFNEIDTIIQPIEKMTEHTGGSYFMTKLEHRSAFLNYLDELGEITSNVIVIGTTNLSPKNNKLDGAAMSRFKNIKEIPLPDENCLFEAIKTNLKNIKNNDSFIKENETKLRELAKEMENKQYSFRNLENLVETSKNYYLDDKLKNVKQTFNFEYLNKAKENISITDGELKLLKT